MSEIAPSWNNRSKEWWANWRKNKSERDAAKAAKAKLRRDKYPPSLSTAARIKEIQKRSKAKHRIKRLASCRARLKIRRKTDPNFKMAECHRTRLRQVLKGYRKSAKTLELLACTIPEFRAHIEAQFQQATVVNGISYPNMTWENHGTVWELDHILPCAAFHLQHSEEQEICFHWTNFQPLFREANRLKRDKIL